MNKLIASEGMTLANGDAFGKVMYLARGDSPDNWREISDAEADAIREKAVQDIAREKKKAAGFEVTPELMSMMGGFTVLRLTSMVSSGILYIIRNTKIVKQVHSENEINLIEEDKQEERDCKEKGIKRYYRHSYDSTFAFA